MSKLNDLLNGRKTDDNIFPLFWQHGEEEHVLRNEIQKMKSADIAGFIVESRPHPDFLGERWWKDLDIIIDEAKRQDMKVWVFDDNAYPSGYSAGLIKQNNPDLVKKYLREDHIDAVGPLSGSSILLRPWYDENETLISVVAARRTDLDREIDSTSLIDITEFEKDGVLYWDIPEGAWRIFIFTCTGKGGEEHTKDYLNPLQKEAVKAYIDYVYETHYEHYKDEFGKTFMGFFTDEPRFGSLMSYEAVLGKTDMVIPFKNGLTDLLSENLGEDFVKYLPLLWYNNDDLSAKARYVYMDTVSTLFADNFQAQIGDWCRKHGVKSIGHVVEDNGAHARLGYGAGHFFKVMKGQDYSGFDVVYHVFPEYTDGKYNSPFGYLDADFFYWGLAKMAVSAAHIDPKKDGITVCEVFGAYGWQEGLKLMKWLTDFICVRGANFIIPHAFSPKYPDSDCPPHFYAQGHNPQWKDFKIWSGYANRVCSLLKGGKHKADAAVLYHAEAEWAGKAQPFEKIVKVLNQNQIDCDIIPIGAFFNTDNFEILDGTFRINNELYPAIIIPYSEYLPKIFINKLAELADNGVTVIFCEDYPSYVLSDKTEKFSCEDIFSVCEKIYNCHTDSIAELLKQRDTEWSVKIPKPDKYFRHYRYIAENMNIYFLTNESKFHTFDEIVEFPLCDSAVIYDAMENKVYNASAEVNSGHTKIRIVLEPYQSLFVIFGSDITSDTCRVMNENLKDILVLEGPWKISKSTAKSYPDFEPDQKLKTLGNISAYDMYPKFSGIVKYTTMFVLDEINGDIFLNIGEAYETVSVKVNGVYAGTRIAPPYLFDITSYAVIGKNEIEIEVTNTLAKAKGENWLDRYMPQEPSGLIGPVKVQIKNADLSVREG